MASPVNRLSVESTNLQLKEASRYLVIGGCVAGGTLSAVGVGLGITAACITTLGLPLIIAGASAVSIFGLGIAVGSCFAYRKFTILTNQRQPIDPPRSTQDPAVERGNAELLSAQAQIQRLEERLAKTHERLQAAGTEIRLVQQDRSQLRSQIQRTEQTLAQTRRELESEKTRISGQTSSLEGEKAVAQAKSKRVQAELETLKNQFKEERGALLSQAERIQNEFERAKTGWAGEKLQMNEEIRALTDEKGEIANKLAEFDRQLEAAQAEIELECKKNEEVLREKDAHIRVILGKNNALRGHLEQNESRVQELTNQLQQVQSELEDAKKNILARASQDEADKKSQKINDGRLKGILEQIKAKEEQSVREKENERQKILGDLANLHMDREHLKRQILEREDQIEKLTAALGETRVLFEKGIRRKDEHIEKLTAALDETRALFEEGIRRKDEHIEGLTAALGETRALFEKEKENGKLLDRNIEELTIRLSQTRNVEKKTPVRVSGSRKGFTRPMNVLSSQAIEKEEKEMRRKISAEMEEELGPLLRASGELQRRHREEIRKEFWMFHAASQTPLPPDSPKGDSPRGAMPPIVEPPKEEIPAAPKRGWFSWAKPFSRK